MDSREVGAHNLERPELICGGDPCQESSNARQRTGLSQASLGDEFIRVVDELRPSLVLRENPMSLYNALCGENPNAALLLFAVGLTKDQIPRYRDVFFEDGHIVVYTRTGGGNREAYMEENAALARHPSYVGDHDDAFDKTFAYFYFRPPAEMVATLKALPSDGTPREKFQAVMDALEAGDENDPRYQKALAVGRPIMEAITAKLTTNVGKGGMDA